MARLLLTETEAPSRSEQGGPCWIAVTGTYATPGGKTIPAEVGATLTVTGKVSLRRAGGRVDVQRSTQTVLVTGDEADMVTVSLGTPQSVAATLSGATQREE